MKIDNLVKKKIMKVKIVMATIKAIIITMMMITIITKITKNLQLK